jgi:hypothetical protein
LARACKIERVPDISDSSSTGNARLSYQTSSLPLSLFIWLAVQTLALTLAALRVPLWARAPEAGEFLAIPILLIVQILSAALLSPRLASDWRIAVMAIACVWPFAVLAGLLAVTGVMTILLAGGYVTGWLIVLFAWQSALESSRSKMIGAAVAATWAASGPLLLFIRTEYGGSPAPTGWMAQIAAGPVMHALHVVDPAGHAAGPWMMLAIAAILGGGTKWGMIIFGSGSAGRARPNQRSQF